VLGLSAVLAGPFEPSREYDRVRADRTWASAALLLLAQLPVLLGQLAAVGGSREVICQSLLGLVRPDFAAAWLEAFGFEPNAAADLVKRLGAPALLPEFGLLSGSPTAIAH